MLLDNIYVINLDRSKDRLNNISKNFSEYGVKFNRYSAVDGKKLDSETINQSSTMLCKTLLCNHGIIGCAMSHLNLWKKLSSDDKTNYYIIFEDDAIINENFKNTVSEIDKIKDQLNFDILSLYCGPSINCQQYQDVYKLPNGIIIGKPIYPLSFTSYIISKNGANKLLSLIKKINYHIDFEVASQIFFSNINFLSLNKNIITHNWDTKSTIELHKHKSIVLYLLNFSGLSQVYWILNLSVFTVNLKYTINLYIALLIFIFIINMLWFKNTCIYILIIIELILYFFL